MIYTLKKLNISSWLKVKKKILLVLLVFILTLVVAAGVFLLVFEHEDYYKEEYVYEKIVGNTYTLRSESRLIREDEYD